MVESENVAALGSGEVRSEHPFVLRLRDVHGAELDLIETQLEARANFLQLNLLPVLLVHVVSVCSVSACVM